MEYTVTSTDEYVVMQHETKPNIDLTIEDILDMDITRRLKHALSRYMSDTKITLAKSIDLEEFIRYRDVGKVTVNELSEILQGNNIKYDESEGLRHAERKIRTLMSQLNNAVNECYYLEEGYNSLLSKYNNLEKTIEEQKDIINKKYEEIKHDILTNDKEILGILESKNKYNRTYLEIRYDVLTNDPDVLTIEEYKNKYNSILNTLTQKSAMWIYADFIKSILPSFDNVLNNKDNSDKLINAMNDFKRDNIKIWKLLDTD